MARMGAAPVPVQIIINLGVEAQNGIALSAAANDVTGVFAARSAVSGSGVSARSDSVVLVAVVLVF